jgi:hypothetical protein
MTPKKIKTIIITGCLLLFAISLTQDAIVTNYEELKGQSSLLYFLIGGTAILGGSLFEFIIWVANPVILVTIYLLSKNDRLAVPTAFVSSILAISFRFWKEILRSESGATTDIISFEPGYYLWALSIIFLNAGVIYYFFIYRDKTSA